VTIGHHFHWQRNEDQQFPGALKLIRSGEHVTAINIVDVESYLASVISSEMNAESSTNFLKAHTIISRSWLLAQLETSRVPQMSSRRSVRESDNERIIWYDREEHDQFDVCADDHCQRYHGMAKVHTPSVHEAVKSTRGVVLTSDGSICDARFSKCCGGVTERFENVWEPVPHAYLVPVVDASRIPEEFAGTLEDHTRAEEWIRRRPPVFCNTNDHDLIAHVLPSFDRETKDFFRWRIEYDQQELADLVSRKSGMDFGGIVDLKPRVRGASGRIVELTIVGTRRTCTIGKELEIRRTLSSSHLFSSAFVVEKRGVKDSLPSHFILHGAGWGHGVGLCQIGAAVMGERGYDHERILSHYFPHTQLTALY
jgi:peptidoglycan hydrolase-like amidase